MQHWCDKGGAIDMMAQPEGILIDLLEREARTLRMGDFARLPVLLAEKEALCANPQLLASVDPAMIDRIAHMARRNDALLAAARAGMRSAMERLGAVARAAEGLRTYNQAGQSSLLAPDAGRPIRRA